MYKGVIIKSSLKEPKVLEEFKVLNQEMDGDWELFTVEATREQIEQLAHELEEGWYTHFWQGRDVVAIFKDKIFEFNFDEKESWKPVVDYGLSIGIPIEQLDFPIE